MSSDSENLPSAPVTAASTMVRVDCSIDAGEFHLRADFSAGPGITVLFGPSGAGKSLTLATIAGLRRPSSGTVQIRGVVVADVAAGRHVRTQDRHVGVVFQDALLLPHRTVEDNVALGVRSGDRTRRRETARALLEAVGASALAGASPRRLSGGERQRVALARALAGDPQLLLLDEPFSALDHLTRRALRSVLRSLVDSTGVPALLVTHDLEEARGLADQTVVFSDGTTTGSVPGFPPLDSLTR